MPSVAWLLALTPYEITLWPFYLSEHLCCLQQGKLHPRRLGWLPLGWQREYSLLSFLSDPADVAYNSEERGTGPRKKGSLYTLQKQASGFNHRVVTMVADKGKRQWPWEVSFDIEDLLHKAISYSCTLHITTTMHWKPSEHQILWRSHYKCTIVHL